MLTPALNFISISPFEQFEIVKLVPLKFSFLDFTISNSTIYMGFSIGLSYLIILILERGFLVPTRWQSLIELIFSQIVSMVNENIGSGKYLALIWSLFSQLTLMNFIGIVPYTFTPTAHIVVAMGFSVSIFVGVMYLGFENYGSNYLAMMMPSGSPMGLAFFLVMIEFVSQLAKAVSLGVRLSANITAGHLLFAILSGFTYTMLCAGGLISLLSIFPLLVVVFITILEMAVAVIQAYVFSILTSIYINDAIHIH